MNANTRKERQVELVVGGYIFWGSMILLILKRGESYFVIPGGHIEYQEKAEQALKREIFEETGIRIKIRKFFRNTELIDFKRHLFCVDYICAPVNSNPGITVFPPSDEIVEARWFNIDDAISSNEVAWHIKTGLKQVINLLKQCS